MKERWYIPVRQEQSTVVHALARRHATDTLCNELRQARSRADVIEVDEPVSCEFSTDILRDAGA